MPAEIDTITGEALIDENANRKNEDVQFFSIFMTVFAVVALLVGAFIISNTFTILVAQRTRELALLRAIGASARRSVARSPSRRSSSAWWRPRSVWWPAPGSRSASSGCGT